MITDLGAKAEERAKIESQQIQDWQAERNSRSRQMGQFGRRVREIKLVQRSRQLAATQAREVADSDSKNDDNDDARLAGAGLGYCAMCSDAIVIVARPSGRRTPLPERQQTPFPRRIPLRFRRSRSMSPQRGASVPISPPTSPVYHPMEPCYSPTSPVIVLD